jgi:stringent starvation protein B
MRSSERPSKYEAFLALLQEGRPSLHLDARRSGVIVPAHLRAEPHLVLQYGHDLPIPIPDLEVDEHGVRATLSFSKNPQRTVIPWSAVYVVTCDDGRGVLYDEDVPEDVSIIATHPHGDRLPDDAAAVSGDLSQDLSGALSDEDVSREIDGIDEVDDSLGGVGSAARARLFGTNGPSGRISERLLRSVPIDEASPPLDRPGDRPGDRPIVGRRRRKPQLRLVK